MARLEVITGPMLAGKSTELIRRLAILEVAGKKILVIKPKMDSRTGTEIAARGGGGKITFPALPVESAEELSILLSKNPYDVLVADEVQFFGDCFTGFADFIEKLLKENADEDLLVIVAGLELDAERKKFGPIGELMLQADDLLKLRAVCSRCKQIPQNAIFTKKIGGTPGQRIEVGDGIYEARCRRCYDLD